MNDVSSEKLLDDWILSGKNEIYSRLEKKYDSFLHLTSKSVLGVMLAKYSMVTTTEKRMSAASSLPNVTKSGIPFFIANRICSAVCGYLLDEL
mgnify:CR=1 FL=1